MRATYEVVARRWRRGWVLHIEGVGVTQSHSLTDAEIMARDYIALDRDVPEDSFDVRVTPEVGDGMDEQVSRTRDAIVAAAQAQINAAESSRALVQKLKMLGLSGKDIAVVLEVTPQRVSQLAAARPVAATARASASQSTAAVGRPARTSSQARRKASHVKTAKSSGRVPTAKNSP